MRINEPVTQKEIRYSDDIKLITITNLKGIITYANDDFVQLSGYSREELIGKNHNLIRHPDMPPGAFQDLWDTIKAGESWRGIVKNRSKSGDHYWVDAYVTPILHNGEIVEYQSVRIKPDEAAKQRADRLYTQWKQQGQLPAYVLRKKMSVTSKNLLALFIPALALLGWSITNLNWLASLLLVAGTLLVASLQTWNRRGIKTLLEEAKKITSNRLMAWIYTGDSDDFALIRYALSIRTSELIAVAVRLADTSHHLEASQTYTNQLLQETNSAISSQSQHVQTVVSTMQQMLSGQQQVTEVASRTTAAAIESQQASIQGRDQINRMITSIKHLADTLQEAKDKVSDLAQQTARIGTVIDVITAVAEQTNLLALNAAIEAARAGEAGRGFAVVADEVRSLAQRTHLSTTEIRDIIQGLIHNTDASVHAIEKGTQASEETVRLAQETDTALESVLNGVNHINELALEVDRAMREQTRLSEQTELEMHTLEVSAQQVMSASQESQQEAERLSERVSNLRKLADHFIKSIGQKHLN